MMMNLDFLQKEEVIAFIQANLNSDTSKLLLNPPTEWKNQISSIVDQIISRNKAKGKLDDWLENPAIIFPPPISIEQASSKATSKYKRHLIKGKHLIDLTGGMGVDCLSLSKSFQQTTYVEQNEVLCSLFDHNSKQQNQPIQIINQSAEEFLKFFSGKAIFYLDPARRDLDRNRVTRLEDCTPNLLDLLPLLQNKAEKVVVKLSPLLDLAHLIDSIPNIVEIHVVAVKNDCKELLLVIDFDSQKPTSIIAANLESNQPTLKFDFKEEKQLKPHIVSLGKYLYEPNVAILKAGGFLQVSAQYELGKLAVNTHLYSSDECIPSFPGKVFEVLEEFERKLLMSYAPKGMINVISRNHSLGAADLKKKMKLKDGGDYFLIAFRDQNNKNQMVFAKRVDQ